MTIFSNIDTNIQSKSIFYTNGHIFTHLTYFTQIFNKSHIFTQLTIFSRIEHILYNHCATFHYDLGFLEFLTFHCGRRANKELHWLMVFLV
jgi:hypothetical protein